MHSLIRLPAFARRCPGKKRPHSRGAWYIVVPSMAGRSAKRQKRPNERLRRGSEANHPATTATLPAPRPASCGSQLSPV